MLGISDVHFWIYAAGVSVALIIVHIIGVMLKLYKSNNWFDIVMHFASGFFLFTPLGFWIAYRSPQQPLWIAELFAFCFGGSVSALWEILEFILDSVFKSNLQQWKDGKKNCLQGSGVIDIMGDIIANFAGSLLACGVILVYYFVF